MAYISPRRCPSSVAFWTPYINSQRGNSTTARRIATGLQDIGIRVEIFAYGEEVWDQKVRERMHSCDVFHILHFYRFSVWKVQQSYKLTHPYLLTSGGTDVNESLLVQTKKTQMKSLLENANAITVFTKDALNRLQDLLPATQGKVSVVPQSVWFPEDQTSLTHALKSGHPKILLPAGLRAVKDVFFLFEALKLLVLRYPMLKFIIVGESLEASVYKRVKQAELEHSWFTYRSGVPLEHMHQFYEWADVVINSSHTEGQPLSLIESMCYQKPVLARNNAGNKSIVRNGVNGYLFSNPEEFRHRIVQLIEKPVLYKRLSRQAKEFVNVNFSLEEEIKQYKKLYLSMKR